MKRIWYIHKWFHGQWKKPHRVCCTFDEADAHAARLAKAHGGRGWTYDVSGSPEQPVVVGVEHG